MGWEGLRLLPGTTASMAYATGTTALWLNGSLYLFGTAVCLMILKFFSFIRGVPALERIGATMYGVILRVLILISALGVVCYAVGSLLYCLFRSNVIGFNGIGLSMVSTIRLFLGDFDTLANVLEASPSYGFGAGFMVIVA